MSKCTFNKAWAGVCGKEDCTEHKDIRCCGCGEPATRSCPYAGTLVCGAPLCDACVHYGTRGGHIPDPNYVPKEMRFTVGQWVTIGSSPILYLIRDKCGNKYRLGSSAEWVEATPEWKEFRVHE